MNALRLFSVLSLPTVLLASSGCAGSSASDDTAATDRASLRAGCAQYAEAQMAKRVECPIDQSDLSVGVGSPEALARTCESLFGAPGSSATEAGLSACAAAMEAASCTEFHGALDECERLFRGTLAKDEDCLFDSQCGSGVCKASTGAVCGHCVNRAGAGERCGIASTDLPCADSLVCLADSTHFSGTCEPADGSPKATVGSACETSCNNPWLSCLDGHCAEKGSTCSSKYSSYECLVGQVCVTGKKSGEYSCQAGTFGQSGASCDTSDGSYCEAGLTCDSVSSTCRSLVQEGGNCEGRSDRCAVGLACIADTCTVPEVDDYSCGEKSSSLL